MAMEIIDDKRRWDGFVDASPQGMLFHKWECLRIIEQYSGYRLRRYGIYKGQELVAIFPIFYKKVGGLRFAYSPPQGTLAYIPHMGPVMSGAIGDADRRRKREYMELIVADLRRELKKFSPDFTSMILTRGMDDVLPFHRDGYDVQIMFTYHTDLRMPVQDVWNNFEGDFKKVIKRCDQHDLFTKRTNDVDALYATMRDRLKSQGRTFFHRQDPEYLRALLAAYPDNLKIDTLYMGDEPIGAKLDCMYKDLYMGWAGGALVFHKIATNEFFEWETIKSAHALGFKWYENWGADMKRLSMFKAKMNPVLVPCYHVMKRSLAGTLSEWGQGMISAGLQSDLMKKLIPT